MFLIFDFFDFLIFCFLVDPAGEPAGRPARQPTSQPASWPAANSSEYLQITGIGYYLQLGLGLGLAAHSCYGPASRPLIFSISPWCFAAGRPDPPLPTR